LRQAPNMLACITGGLVSETETFYKIHVTKHEKCQDI